MILSRAISTRLGLLVMITAAATGLVACSPQPSPSPSPTAAFATEEEAFAAAEETYRAYNDAGNSRRAGAAEPNPQDFLMGAALEGDIEALNYMRENGVQLQGAVQVHSFAGTETDLTSVTPTLEAVVCLDASNTRMINDAGEDITPADRPDIVAQTVTFAYVDAALLISNESSSEASAC